MKNQEPFCHLIVYLLRCITWTAIIIIIIYFILIYLNSFSQNAYTNQKHHFKFESLCFYSIYHESKKKRKFLV